MKLRAFALDDAGSRDSTGTAFVLSVLRVRVTEQITIFSRSGINTTGSLCCQGTEFKNDLLHWTVKKHL